MGSLCFFFRISIRIYDLHMFFSCFSHVFLVSLPPSLKHTLLSLLSSRFLLKEVFSSSLTLFLSPSLKLTVSIAFSSFRRRCSRSLASRQLILRACPSQKRSRTKEKEEIYFSAFAPIRFDPTFVCLKDDHKA